MRKIWMIILLAFVLLTTSRLVKAPQLTMMGLQGKVTDASDSAVTSGNLTINISTSTGCGGEVFNRTYSNPFTSDGLFDIMIGEDDDFQVDFNRLYYLCLLVNDEQVGGPYKFRGGQGQVSSDDISKNITVLGNLTVDEQVRGKEQLFLEENVVFLNLSFEQIFSIYLASEGKRWSNVPGDFNKSLIFETDRISNANQMEVCFWDNETQRMIMCLNEGALLRATTVRRSFQIVGNTSDKENDENFTLCENVNYVDCSDVTGADLFVQDDIEALGSIYANEDVVGVSFNGSWNGSDELAESMDITNTNINVRNISADNINADLVQAPLGKFTNITSDKINTDLLVTYNVESTNISATNIFIDNIIFGFGEKIDNIIDGLIRIIGNLNITGNITGNQHYGFMNITQGSETITISTQNTWYNLTTYSIETQNGFLPATNGMKSQNPGTYKIDYSVSFTCTANTQYRYSVALNYVPVQECATRASVGVPNEAENVAGTCILSLSEDDIISVMVQNIDSTTNPTIKDSQVTLIRIGD